MRLLPEPLLERREQPRLADPRLAGEEHHPALAAPGLPPAPQQQVDLLLAADQRRQGRGVERLEPARRRADAEDAVRADRRGEALGLDRAQVGALEQVADEPARGLGDHDAAGLGQRLQPGGQVRGLADDRLLPGGPAAEQVADHDQPGRDADADPERGPGRPLEVARRRHEREPGADRPLGVVLVRPRVAEVGQHAVAHVLGDEAALPLDRRRDAAVVGADQLAQVLGVEAGGERGRADQVDEHHRELTPLGPCLARRRPDRGRRRRPERPSPGRP